MKNIFYLILISHIFLSCFQKKLDCKDFKSGTYESISKENNLKFLIIRENNQQIEKAIDLKTNKNIAEAKVSKIVWISDCEYKLLIDTIKTKANNIEKYINSNGGLKNKIVKIENNCATIETTFEATKMSLEYCKIR